MPDNFERTVNLKDKTVPASVPKNVAKIQEKSLTSRTDGLTEKKFEQIDKLLGDSSNALPKRDMQTINRPDTEDGSNLILLAKTFLAAVLVVAVIFFAYRYLFRSQAKSTQPPIGAVKWYMVVLNDGESFYGRIGDIKSDPVVIESVYYNYDKDSKETEAGQNLRLVKRGKEAQGGDGTISIIRSNVKYLEALREDSKVLRAITEYEQNK